LSDMKNMLDWFSRRKGDLVQSGTRGHALVISDVVTEVDKAISAMANGNRAEASKCVERLIVSEREADRIEDRLCAEMSTGELPPQEREDLLHFVKKSDTIADWAKEAGLYVQMICDIDAEVPREVWENINKATAELVVQVKMLLKAIESMGGERNETLRLVDAIKDQERIIDGLYFKVLKCILTSDMDTKGIVLTRSIIEALEMAADTCKQCADTISILIVSRRS